MLRLYKSRHSADGKKPQWWGFISDSAVMEKRVDRRNLGVRQQPYDAYKHRYSRMGKVGTSEFWPR